MQRTDQGSRRFLPFLLVVILLAVAALIWAHWNHTGRAVLANVKYTWRSLGALPADDYPSRKTYAADDAELAAKPAPAAGGRVVFLGDSITALWAKPENSSFFQRHPEYVNRGIGGQTTAQMLLRFRQDVLSLQPGTVVLLAGVNDLETDRRIEFAEQNIESIVELARLHNERVILCSLLPVRETPKNQTESHPPAQILALNGWLREFAAANHLTFVDFYAVVSDGHDRMPLDLTVDGLHPKPAAYARMEPLVEAALASPAPAR